MELDEAVRAVGVEVFSSAVPSVFAFSFADPPLRSATIPMPSASTAIVAMKVEILRLRKRWGLRVMLGPFASVWTEHGCDC